MTEDSVRSVANTMPNGQEIDDPLSLNLYTYCYNNPIRYYDPSGSSADEAAKNVMTLQEYFASGGRLVEGIAYLAGAIFTPELILLGGVVVLVWEYAPEGSPEMTAAVNEGAAYGAEQGIDYTYANGAAMTGDACIDEQGQLQEPIIVEFAAEHTKRSGSKKKTNDKHTNPRPGRASEAKKQSPNWSPHPNKRAQTHTLE